MKPWTEPDLAILRAHYPTGGAPAVIPLLSIERTRDQVNKAAKRRGIKCYRRDQVNVGCPWRRWNGPRELDRTTRAQAQMPTYAHGANGDANEDRD